MPIKTLAGKEIETSIGQNTFIKTKINEIY